MNASGCALGKAYASTHVEPAHTLVHPFFLKHHLNPTKTARKPCPKPPAKDPKIQTNKQEEASKQASKQVENLSAGLR